MTKLTQKTDKTSLKDICERLIMSDIEQTIQKDRNIFAYSGLEMS